MRSNSLTPCNPATGLRLSLLNLIPVLLMLLFNVAQAAEPGTPSACAKGMPGALGTFEYKPDDFTGKDSWWIDSDGTDPAVAGCHIGVDENRKRNGRKFGEGCDDKGFLIESNPGKEALHMHTGDLGHPDLFDCKQWCIGTNKGTTGSCKVVKGPKPCVQSARCHCK